MIGVLGPEFIEHFTDPFVYGTFAIGGDILLFELFRNLLFGKPFRQALKYHQVKLFEFKHIVGNIQIDARGHIGTVMIDFLN